MQSVKTDSAAVIADGDAKNWVEALPIAIKAYNKRPHSAVHGPPETVEERPEQDFRVLQDNARKGLLNRNSHINKSKALREAGAFRAPLPSKRSFEPRYGDVQLLGATRKGDENDMVRNRGEGKFQLNLVQPVNPTSAKSAGAMTEKNVPRVVRFADRASDIEEHIRSAGGRMEISVLEKQVRRGLLGLAKLFRRNRITVRGFLRLYPAIFTSRSGFVTVRNATAVPDPARVPKQTADPIPGSAEFNALPIPERMRITDARSAARQAARKEALRMRGQGMKAKLVYG